MTHPLSACVYPSCVRFNAVWRVSAWMSFQRAYPEDVALLTASPAVATAHTTDGSWPCQQYIPINAQLASLGDLWSFMQFEWKIDPVRHASAIVLAEVSTTLSGSRTVRIARSSNADVCCTCFVHLVALPGRSSSGCLLQPDQQATSGLVPCRRAARGLCAGR